MKLRLKVPKLNWKQKVDKLRRIVLACPAIEDPPPWTITLIEAWRGHTHGKLDDDGFIRAVQDIGPHSGERLIWEPYSDERGEVEPLFGWQLQATIFGINGQPWWFVKAYLERAGDATEHQLQMINKAVSELGCHDTARDLIQEFPDEEGRWTMFWNWFHTGPLLEIHLHPTAPMLIVNEGTPLKDGYARMERISRGDASPSPPADEWR